MTSRITRRSFLAVGAGALVVTACGGGSDSGAGDRATTTSKAGNPPDDLEVLQASAQLFAGVGDQRLTFGVLRDAAPLAAGTTVEYAIGKSFAATGPMTAAEFHNQGIEDRPYYKATANFDRPGDYVLTVRAGRLTGATPITVYDPSQTDVPRPSQKMVPVATPTTTDARGVDPICTRKPACPFHDVSLDAALAERRPVAALFATPALCQSRVCGPVLDVLMDASEGLTDRVRFVHVEVYKSLDAQPSVDQLTDGMRAYHLQFEPVLYLAAPDGTIQQRLDGPYDLAEARQSLAALAGS
jgi:hypothetical protein